MKRPFLMPVIKSHYRWSFVLFGVDLISLHRMAQAAVGFLPFDFSARFAVFPKAEQIGIIYPVAEEALC